MAYSLKNKTKEIDIPLSISANDLYLFYEYKEFLLKKLSSNPANLKVFQKLLSLLKFTLKEKSDYEDAIIKSATKKVIAWGKKNPGYYFKNKQTSFDFVVENAISFFVSSNQDWFKEFITNINKEYHYENKLSERDKMIVSIYNCIKSWVKFYNVTEWQNKLKPNEGTENKARTLTAYILMQFGYTFSSKKNPTNRDLFQGTRNAFITKKLKK